MSEKHWRRSLEVELSVQGYLFVRFRRKGVPYGSRATEEEKAKNT